MSEAWPPVDLVFLWHHHQPDYRSPRDGRALLPWVRLHATKDYLDMALRLGRHPRVRSTFNFVPSLLDQLEFAAGGGSDQLFDLLQRPIGSLTRAERDEVAARTVTAPRHALERWPAYRRRVERQARARGGNGGPRAASDSELLALEVWFLLAWTDPMFHDTPEVQTALAAAEEPTESHRNALLALHTRLVGEVIPAYRALAESGQIELSESAYYHPILPLLIHSQTARRARPDLSLPAEPFSAPEDAARQVERALERHAAAFGARPFGMWPPEGSVSPESVEIAARAGVRWLATDEGVLWLSLAEPARQRGALYRPWRFETAAGEVSLFFRDHELSDRVGFVYQHWDPKDAVADFMARIRRIAREHQGAEAPVVSVILDGENCWEHYADDGGPFLDALYAALEEAEDVRTRTPSELLAAGRLGEPLPALHSGSWINADFRIWIGHPEKNRAWELLSRARRALIAGGATPETHAEAWESLYAAEGSDWFWWFGDDHFTPDKDLFDRLFREHLQAAYERAGLEPPAWLQVPIATSRVGRVAEHQPLEFIRPRIDGRHTQFYEWHGAGHHRLGAGGGSMHRNGGWARDFYFGFDAERLYLRLDFAAGPPGPEVDFAVDFLTPRPVRIVVHGLVPGAHDVEHMIPGECGAPLVMAQCHIDTILELAVPFSSLGLEAGESVEALAQLLRGGQPIETIPTNDLVRFTVPDESFEAAMWSA